MTSMTERTLWKTIKARTPERAYYFFGDDDYLKEQATRALIDAVIEPATRDFNLDVRNAADTDAAVLGSLLGTPPMMAERRVVVLRDVGALKKDARIALDQYLATPAEDLVLVMIAPGGDKAKIDKTLQSKATDVEFTPLDSNRVTKWIAHHVETEHGATIATDAADLLHRAVGNDLSALAAELDKLVSYASGSEITQGAVADVVGVRHGETLGDWLDKVADRDAAGALALLPHILEQPKTTAVSIVMALTVQMLALAWGEAARRERGGRLDFFDFLKSGGGVFTGRPWGEAATAWAKYASNWDSASLDAALDSLLAADIALKETRLSSDDQLLSSLVLAMCARDAVLA
ncbi:MAG: DNA polymerase III subunit delta [Gemmatimonadota bacterium]|nr:DNA polymerase III subunit delta [Gemmatimonadota bacterium]